MGRRSGYYNPITLDACSSRRKPLLPLHREAAPGITMVLLAFGTLVHRLSLPFEFRLIKVLEALALPIRNTLLVSLGAQIESNLHG